MTDLPVCNSTESVAPVTSVPPFSISMPETESVAPAASYIQQMVAADRKTVQNRDESIGPVPSESRGVARERQIFEDVVPGYTGVY